jgi:hypothetical protein
MTAPAVSAWTGVACSYMAKTVILFKDFTVSVRVCLDIMERLIAVTLLAVSYVADYKSITMTQ